MTERTFALAGRVLLLAGLAIFAYLFWLPDVGFLKKDNPKLTRYVEIYVRRRIYERVRPVVFMKWVPLDQISPYLRRAVLIAEDDRFYKHRGVDWVELKIAVRSSIRKGHLSRGASTITQQVARNLFLSPSRSPERKLKELLIARYIERVLDKDRILEIYLNIVEWGEGIFGAEAASLAYYDKHASDLTPEEAVELAVALSSPYRFNPARPPDDLVEKKKVLFMDRMRKAGILPLEDAAGGPKGQK